jgi:hypothetical protein
MLLDMYSDRQNRQCPGRREYRRRDPHAKDENDAYDAAAPVHENLDLYAIWREILNLTQIKPVIRGSIRRFRRMLPFSHILRPKQRRRAAGRQKTTIPQKNSPPWELTKTGFADTMKRENTRFSRCPGGLRRPVWRRKGRAGASAPAFETITVSSEEIDRWLLALLHLYSPFCPRFFCSTL